MAGSSTVHYCSSNYLLTSLTQYRRNWMEISLKAGNKLTSCDGDFVKPFPSFKSFREVKWKEIKWKEKQIKCLRGSFDCRYVFLKQYYRVCYLLCVMCTIFWLLSLIPWCNFRNALKFMEPKGHCTSVVSIVHTMLEVSVLWWGSKLSNSRSVGVSVTTLICSFRSLHKHLIDIWVLGATTRVQAQKYGWAVYQYI